MTSLPYIIEAIQTHTLDPTLKFYPELYPVSCLPTPYSSTLPSLPLLLLQAHITLLFSFSSFPILPKITIHRLRLYISPDMPSGPPVLKNAG